MAKLASEDKDVIVLVGDLGYSFMEPFARTFPDQFINCGIAEQNMIGVAAGLALAGKKPYVYTGAVFYYRCLEQVRDDIAYNNLDVKLIGTGASGFLGFTHNFSEEEKGAFIDLFFSIPNLIVQIPDAKSLPYNLTISGPTYIQL